MYDSTGRTIEVGDKVTYPVRRGSSLWVNRGTVTKVDEEREKIQVEVDMDFYDVHSNMWTTCLRKVTITRVENVTIYEIAA